MDLNSQLIFDESIYGVKIKIEEFLKLDHTFKTLFTCNVYASMRQMSKIGSIAILDGIFKNVTAKIKGKRKRRRHL